MSVRPAAVVSACDRPNGLAAIRSLGRRGIDVVAVDSDPRAVGMRSRYARAAVAPSPAVDEGAFVDFVAALAERLDRPAVFFATSDVVLRAMAKNRRALGDRLLCPFPGWDVLGDVQDKWFQLRTAEAAGIPVPRTVSRPTVDLGFPMVVKPASTFPFRKRYPGVHAFLCADLAEAESAYARCADFRPLVQEFVPGGEDALYTLGTYVSADGEALGLFCGRKLRQAPPVVGSCRVAEAVWVDEVVEQGLAFVRALEYRGICQVEFKRDARDGAFRLIEINPRPWNWHGLAAACGVDVIRLAYDDLSGMRPPVARMTGEGKRWAITLLGRTRPAPQRPPYVDAVFARDDVRPALADVGRQVASGGRRLSRLARRAIGPRSGNGG